MMAVLLLFQALLCNSMIGFLSIIQPETNSYAIIVSKEFIIVFICGKGCMIGGDSFFFLNQLAEIAKKGILGILFYAVA